MLGGIWAVDYHQVLCGLCRPGVRTVHFVTGGAVIVRESEGIAPRRRGKRKCKRRERGPKSRHG